MDHNTDAIATLPRAFYGLEINNPELFGLTYEVEKFNKNGQTVDIGYVVQCFDDRYQTLMPSLQEYDLTAINLQFEEEKKDEIEHSYHCVFRGKDFVSVAIGIDFLAAVYAAAYSSLPDFKAMLHQFEKILPLSMQFAKGLCNCLNEFNFLKLGCLADAALIRNEDWKSQVKIKQELLASYLQRKIEVIENEKPLGIHNVYEHLVKDLMLQDNSIRNFREDVNAEHKNRRVLVNNRAGNSELQHEAFFSL